MNSDQKRRTAEQGVAIILSNHQYMVYKNLHIFHKTLYRPFTALDKGQIGLAKNML